MIAPARWLAIAVPVAIAPVIASADQTPSPAATDHKLMLRLGAGVAYLRESWSPNDGNPGSVQTGWAPALEITAGRVLSPRLVLGGIWQLATVFDPTEAFAGNNYDLSDEIKFLSLAGAFVEDPRLPRVPIRAGIAVGAVVSSLLDKPQGQFETRFAIAVAPYLGYDRRLSTRWQIGLLARVTFYRSIAGDAPSPATTNGLLPCLLLTSTFR